jgi:calcineurin-like phosphoesterase family protein
MRKPTFFTSDLHIGHENCLKFDNRPFDTLEDMHRALIKRYNSVVPKDGICYFLGDVGLCSGDTIKNVISKMNGTKVLILGNHDKKQNAMYALGFDVVLYNASIMIQGQLVTMTHCPLRGLYREDVTGMKGATDGENWHGESRQLNYSIDNHGQFHLHGHIHCLSDDTEALTKEGWKLHNEITLDDYVLTRCPKTGKDSWKKV